MLTHFSKIPYDYEKIKLNRIFEHPDYATYPNLGMQSKESLAVYGQLRFPTLPKDRAYTMACFVTSLDGKIAYPDNPAGPVIAQSNFLDPDGATADFWVLNLLRANVDAVIAGAGTMQKEPNSTIHIFDQPLEDERIKANLPKAPWVVISSLDGTDVPFGDTMMENQPVMFNTSPEGAVFIADHLTQAYYLVGPYSSLEKVHEDREKIVDEFAKHKHKKIPIIATGTAGITDSAVLLGILKLLGMDKVMVESPSYCHSLLQTGLLDEFVFNYSCVYIGGKALGFGSSMAACTSTDHPHTEMLTIHAHSPSFFYFRQKVVYGLKPEGYLGVIY